MITTESLTVALIGRGGAAPAVPDGIRLRPVDGPDGVDVHDDVVLFHGPGLAPELMRLRSTRTGAPPAVFLAPRLDRDDVHLALDHGAAGYLLDGRYGFLLPEALRWAVHGGCVLDPLIAAEQLAATAPRRGTTTPAPSARAALTPREHEVMELLARGYSVREVAGALGLTEKTVRNYLTRVYEKLEVNSRARALLCWRGAGL